MAAVPKTVEAVEALERYAHGFVTDIETEFAPRGLSEEVIRFISAKKDEPDWMLQWRLEAYQRWLEMVEPTWAHVEYEPAKYDELYYWAAPKAKEGP